MNTQRDNIVQGAPSMHTSSLHTSPEPFHGESGELKGCPFCGGPATKSDEGAIMCSDANCVVVCGVPAMSRKGHDAIAIWNTRTPDPESAAEIERLRRERDEARQIVTEANNSLFGSQNYFHSINGGPFDKYHLANEIEKRKSDSLTQWRKLTTAESLLAAAWENAAKIAESYQPHGRMQHHGTRQGIAAALRAASLENVSTKTAESGHSPSTREG